MIEAMTFARAALYRLHGIRALRAQAPRITHQAADFGFNVVKRPSGASWFTNQAFTGGQ